MILLMTTAPPTNAPWYLGRKLPPLGLAYVAAALEKKGFQVEILDNYLLKKPAYQLERLIREKNPEIVGITCGSATYKQCIETAKAIKNIRPSCKVVTGGWHPSYVPESMLCHPEIDYVVIGEGEDAMTKLATHILKGEDDRALDIIPGIAYKYQGKMIKNAPKFIEDLDEIPFPARHLLPMHLYDRTNELLGVKPVDVMSITRGCPYSCAFCEVRKMWGSVCRSFSPKRVVDEIKYMNSKYQTKGIYFINDNFTIHEKKTMQICEMMKKSKLDIEWVCDTRVNLISRELLRKMKSAGCKTMWFGVESGSPRILEKVNKGITIEQTAQAFKLCKEEGIQTACSFLLGIPGETVGDMNATLKFAKKLDPDWCRFNIFVAYPDSTLYEEVLQKHLYDRKEDFLLYVRTNEFDYQSLLKIQRQFHKVFNRSPKRIIRRGFLSVLRYLN